MLVRLSIDAGKRPDQIMNLVRALEVIYGEDAIDINTSDQNATTAVLIEVDFARARASQEVDALEIALSGFNRR